MDLTMSDTSNATSAAVNGLQRNLRPWEIAVKCFRTDAGQIIDIEHASDEEFQQFVRYAGIPVKDKGITEWSFDDRCGVITFAIRRGIVLPFVDTNNSEDQEGKGTIRELFVGNEPAPEGA